LIKGGGNKIRHVSLLILKSDTGILREKFRKREFFYSLNAALR